MAPTATAAAAAPPAGVGDEVPPDGDLDALPDYEGPMEMFEAVPPPRPPPNKHKTNTSPPTHTFFNDTATTEIYTALNTLSLHDALP
eukprot:COSAG04_NODE_11823_length_686_cov_0.761499_2_plen_86_part_01